jgi:type II secretory pathway predicted ATPase ExeA
MYKTFYKLTSNPFGSSPDPRFLYMMPHTREALAGLEYGISARKGFLVLVGEVGTGKTTLLRRALSGFDPRRVFTSFVFNPLLEPLDFLQFVMADFGIATGSRTKSGMLIQFNRWLVERFRHQETCVVLVDEAQNLSWELFEEIRLLTNLETSSEKLLQIVLSGQPELEDKLRQPNVRQLRQRIAMWCRTQPITHAQTSAYIAQRLLVAGSSEPLFTGEAVNAIYRASRGIPRVINLVCEHALILGYVEQTREISAELILEVARDLDLDTQPFLVSSSQGAGLQGSAAPLGGFVGGRTGESAHASVAVPDMVHTDGEESER